MRAFRKFASLFVVATLGLSACGSNDTPKKKELSEEMPLSPSRDTSGLHVNAAQPSSYQPDVYVPKDKGEEALLKEAIEVQPSRLSEFMSRGKERFSAGNLSGALEDYQGALAKAPNALSPNIQLARTHLAMGNVSAARQPAELAIEIDGSSSFAWNTLGRVELLEADFEAAIVSFERAVEENEDNSYAWNNLGFALIESEQYSEAVDALEHATSGESPKAYMWNNLGMAYEHLDQITLARASYQMAAEEGANKAQLNFDRLEGVVSLLVESENEELDSVEEVDDELDETDEVESEIGDFALPLESEND